MKVEIIDTQRGLVDLAYAWNELATRCDNLSLYSSYAYNRIAWEYFSNRNDSLFVLVLYDAAELKAIAPFRISLKKLRFINTRTIEFIAAWEGDRPSIIAPGCEQDAWNSIFIFLTSEYYNWDIFKIMEQPRDSVLHVAVAIFRNSGYFYQIAHDSTSYYVDLSGSWDFYYATVKPSVKKTLSKRIKKHESLANGLYVETITEPERVSEALNRFIILEKMSWKGEAKIGIQSDKSLQSFYGELTQSQARQKQAEMHFLRVGDKDIAGSIKYKYHNVIYMRHVAYNPEYAKLSPGTQLLVYELQYYFGKGLKEYDMMGMHPNEGIPRYKAEWASGTRETKEFLIFKKRLKLMPEILWRRLKGRIKREN